MNNELSYPRRESDGMRRRLNTSLRSSIIVFGWAMGFASVCHCGAPNSEKKKQAIDTIEALGGLIFETGKAGARQIDVQLSGSEFTNDRLLLISDLGNVTS